MPPKKGQRNRLPPGLSSEPGLVVATQLDRNGRRQGREVICTISDDEALLRIFSGEAFQPSKERRG